MSVNAIGCIWLSDTCYPRSGFLKLALPRIFAFLSAVVSFDHSSLSLALAMTHTHTLSLSLSLSFMFFSLSLFHVFFLFFSLSLHLPIRFQHVDQYRCMTYKGPYLHVQRPTDRSIDRSIDRDRQRDREIDRCPSLCPYQTLS